MYNYYNIIEQLCLLLCINECILIINMDTYVYFIYNENIYNLLKQQSYKVLIRFSPLI